MKACPCEGAFVIINCFTQEPFTESNDCHFRNHGSLMLVKACLDYSIQRNHSQNIHDMFSSILNMYKNTRNSISNNIDIMI